MSDDNHYKGTTTIGIICENGLVLATEKRATMGHFIASKDAKKIYQLDDTVGMTTAGSVGDAQKLVQIMKVESQLYKMRRHESMTLKGMTNLLSNILNNSRYYPYMVQLIVGGVDKNGPSIYSLDAIGGLIDERKAVATGSGSMIAYGVLEDRYVDGMSLEEGAKLAIRALTNAMKRDSASGNGVSLVKITKDSYEIMSDEDIQAVIESLQNKNN